MKSSLLLDLYKQEQTVFSINELSLKYPDLPAKDLARRMSYYAKRGKIKRLRKGIYAKAKYDLWELANKIYTPSYLSLETVLRKHGLIFQESKVVTLVSYLSREIICQKHKISYRKIKKEILLDKTGVVEKNHYYLASPERAFLDSVFVYKSYYFDNLSGLDWDKVEAMLPIYQSPILNQRVAAYRKNQNESA